MSINGSGKPSPDKPFGAASRADGPSAAVTVVAGSPGVDVVVPMPSAADVDISSVERPDDDSETTSVPAPQAAATIPNTITAVR